MAYTDAVPISIERLMFDGLLQRVGEVFEVTAPTFNSSTDRFRIQQILAQQQTKTVEYPICYIHVTGIDDPEAGASYNALAILKYGGYTQADGTVVLKQSILPVKFNIELVFLTDDFFKALRFMNQWKFANRLGKLNMTINYGGADIDIKVSLESSLSTPDKDASVDIQNVYEYTGQITINGYMSSVDPQDSKQVDIVRTQSTSIQISFDEVLSSSSVITDTIPLN